jgi:hypothetical protein
MAIVLVIGGADKEAKDPQGCTPLLFCQHLCVHSQVVEALVNGGVDWHSRFDHL